MAPFKKKSQSYEVHVSKKYRLFPSFRFVILVVLFLGSFAVNANFYSMNFAITCMVNSTYLETNDPSTASSNTNATTSSPFSPKCGDVASTALTDYRGTFLWDRKIQSTVLAGEAIGAVWFILLTGWLLDKYGARWLYFGSMMILAAMSFLLPVAAHHGWGWAFAVRFFQGIGMEICWPAIFFVTTRWFPVQELGLVSGLAGSGFQAASLFTMVTAGFFCSSSLGWEGLYYMIGLVTLLCAVIWLLFYSNQVSHARWISAAEVAHIKRHRSVADTDSGVVIPFRAIFTSLPVWAIVVMNFSCFYVFYFVGDYIPTYFKEALGIRSDQSGLMAALPFLAQFLGQNIAGVGSDRLSKLISPTASVKTVTGLCGFCPAIFLSVMTIFDCNTAWYAVACLTGAYFFYGFAVGGFMKSGCLVAPRFTGTITGLCTTATYVAGILAPYLTGIMTPNGTLEEWRVAFYVAAAIISAGTLFFLIFGSGDPQPWSHTGEDEKYRMSVISYKQRDVSRRISVAALVNSQIIVQEAPLWSVRESMEIGPA